MLRDARVNKCQCRGSNQQHTYWHPTPHHPQRPQWDPYGQKAQLSARGLNCGRDRGGGTLGQAHTSRLAAILPYLGSPASPMLTLPERLLWPAQSTPSSPGKHKKILFHFILIHRHNAEKKKLKTLPSCKKILRIYESCIERTQNT